MEMGIKIINKLISKKSKTLFSINKLEMEHKETIHTTLPILFD